MELEVRREEEKKESKEEGEEEEEGKNKRKRKGKVLEPYKKDVKHKMVHIVKWSKSKTLLGIGSGTVLMILNVNGMKLNCIETDGDKKSIVRIVDWNVDDSLIITANDDKIIRLWEVSREGQVSCIGKRSHSKRINQILFIGDKIVYADKSGLVFSCSLVDFAKESVQPTLELGHLSTITDAVYIENYLVTCDKDEKIRVSTYPQAFHIQAFCLGHKKYITKIFTVNSITDRLTFLVSGSGDSTLKVWDYKSGQLLFSQSLKQSENDEGDLCVVPIGYDPISSTLAVICEENKFIELYQLITDQNQVRLIKTQRIELIGEPIALDFDGNSNLWLSVIDSNQELKASNQLLIYERTKEQGEYKRVDFTSNNTNNNNINNQNQVQVVLNEIESNLCEITDEQLYWSKFKQHERHVRF